MAKLNVIEVLLNKGLINIKCLFHGQQGSGTLLVRLHKDAGTPSNECSLSEF